MRNFFICFLFLNLYVLNAQELTNNFKRYPVFSECENQLAEQLQSCFTEQFRIFFYENFKEPEDVIAEQYKGKVSLLFEVTQEGKFKLLYADAVYASVKEELESLFLKLPVIVPATYSSRPTYMQFSFNFNLPLNSNIEDKEAVLTKSNSPAVDFEKEVSGEWDSIVENQYNNNEFESELNIPFSHQVYGVFDASLNQVGSNNHTASKPYLYSEVANYYDLNARNKSLAKSKKSWWGKKWWNEHMISVAGKGYWFTADPIADLQLGKDNSDEVDFTYNNTRGVYIQGGLGKKLAFSTSLFESQGRFADYYNNYARSIRPDGGNPAIIPGRGIAKEFNEDAFDYPVAEGYLSFTPGKHFNIQLGHGRNFIGDGYRSLFLSDVASPYPFIKLNTSFWKIKYTNLWMSLRDVRGEATEDGAFLTKYVASHYLSWNVSPKLNVGFFESVIWDRRNDRGFDLNYLNPLIFYRFIEFSTGSRAGNALIGLSGKYKWNDRFNLYGQLILDELSVKDIFGGEQSWKNKYGIQIGAKFYQPFNVENLMFQLEYNRVRPYTYSHNTIVLNYGHNNQPLAHLWGANFSEIVGIANYNYGRWFGTAKLIYGKRGFDFNSTEDSFVYGGDIYTNEENRPSDNGIEIGQGNNVNTLVGDIQGGYLVNPSTNLKVYINLTYRNFDPTFESATTFNNTTVWFNVGLRTDLFNWYTDF
ncbi:gliding motility protein RemB [Ascidiimonas sp. W6]|uniref:gliding motility protein RemB n=1 Tax=Ascidiimonas meishanensis TaxID=3128903 RepID=UPI0030EBA9D4